jgi:hypothetical protein
MIEFQHRIGAIRQRGAGRDELQTVRRRDRVVRARPLGLVGVDGKSVASGPGAIREVGRCGHGSGQNPAMRGG